MATFAKDEERIISHAKEAVVKYNKLRKAKGGIDTLYAFVMSDSGKIYDGACLETNLSHSNICAERHAIANMILQETYKAKVKIVVVADPVPKIQEHSTPPCGTCRHIIREFGKPDTTIILMQYIQQKTGWVFPKIEKHKIKELYPRPYVPVKWD
ncbi:MAG: hypothetical protein COY38_02160 [Candidatus Aenigmarchaeota archaeon CG_4_10_14_0_8_um_filter_37_24]|nr:hypothetical protein [Candidatus Aenigmarchaeota archaeon]OIN87340.1 MAG: hypothetical protein AUJ50_02750 [Candidatus Aenigmarchaeota archaeon CG1_02_38_14]PIV69051.1 MAG: hypothetical protein COS07_02105 [Candidatus Aenigmarchaeota archaeon CG01_land_8_20_14_3_00_37_9]PIW41008.1 MAG: hypothetical protein COW21_04145 [Candidatus Aenigmarchaeota archaeon CG15_BIG_FIL_POST_REV_8_21_14_020_37_27]PIX50629.1 MAG: hypothetical protein COZ52_03020 [Candidatus Aenigmarchaeota archaeon CG_4_8_14_3_u